MYILERFGHLATLKLRKSGYYSQASLLVAQKLSDGQPLRDSVGSCSATVMLIISNVAKVTCASTDEDCVCCATRW